MEEYLIKHNIPYTIDPNVFILPNFTCFTVKCEDFDDEHLFGRDEKFNDLLKKLRLNNYRYKIEIFHCNNTILEVSCIFAIGEIQFLFMTSLGYKFDIIHNCYNYIINNVNYSKIDNLLGLIFTVGKYEINFKGDYIKIYTGLFGNTVYLETFDEFIEYVKKHMSEYIINHDIKIALKN